MLPATTCLVEEGVSNARLVLADKPTVSASVVQGLTTAMRMKLEASLRAMSQARLTLALMISYARRRGRAHAYGQPGPLSTQAATCGRSCARNRMTCVIAGAKGAKAATPLPAEACTVAGVVRVTAGLFPHLPTILPSLSTLQEQHIRIRL